MCGVKNINEYSVNQLELDGLKDLKRGVFAKNEITKGSDFTQDDVFFAMPKVDNQMTSEEFSKHNLSFTATDYYNSLEAINYFEIKEKDIKGKIASFLHTVKSQLNQAKIVINKDSNIELSHHYGIEKIDEYGAVIIDCINEEYCKKIIVLIPNQIHPEHFHIKKKESFQILHGDLYLEIDSVENKYKAGDIITVQKNQKHSFRTEGGVVFEEVSTTHYKNDSFYSDDDITNLTKRKTNLKDWWLQF
jgi:N-acetylneuraminate synthase